MPNDVEVIDGKQDEIIVDNIQSVLSSLSSENNVVEFSDESFNCENYVKVDDKFIESLNLSYMSSFFSSVSSAVASTLNTVSADQINKVFEKGVFAVVFKNGVNDKTVTDLFKNSEGNLITSYYGGRGIEQAGLKEITNGSFISKAANTANLANGIMSVAAFALGCYYMSSINDKMTCISSKLDEIRVHLDNDKISQLERIHNSIERNLKYFQEEALNDEYLDRFKNSLASYCDLAQDITGTYEKDIEGFVERFEHCNEKFCKDDQNYRDLLRYWNIYKFSASIYVEAFTVDTIISKNLKSAYLNGQIKALEDFAKKFNDNHKRWDKAIKKRINEVHLPLCDGLKKLAPLAPYATPLTIVSPKIPIRLNKVVGVDKLIQKQANAIEEKKRKTYNEKFDFLGNDTFDINPNMKPLLDYVNRINLIQKDEFAICYHNGSMYIDKKYLETEVN